MKDYQAGNKTLCDLIDELTPEQSGILKGDKMRLRITNDRYDNTGTIYEFDSKEDLVREMLPTLKTWAEEQLTEAIFNHVETTKNEILKEMKIELSISIEEVTDEDC